jgi:hypothetical protein
MGKNVFVLAPVPEFEGNVPKRIGQQRLFTGRNDEMFISTDAHREKHKVVWAALEEARRRCGITILDPTPYFCADSRCSASKEGRPLYLDTNHVSEFGARALIPLFRRALRGQHEVRLIRPSPG